MEELFFLDFSANIPSMNSGSNHETPISPCCKEPTLNRDPSPYSSILVVGKKVPNSGCSITKRRKFSQEDQGETLTSLCKDVKNLKVSRKEAPGPSYSIFFSQYFVHLTPCSVIKNMFGFVKVRNPDLFLRDSHLWLQRSDISSITNLGPDISPENPGFPK